MADIASTDVTITIVKNQLVRGSPGAERRNLVKIAFGDGSLTYGSGVPLPAAAKFGMAKSVDYLHPVDSASASTMVWKYDYANNKLRSFGVIATTAAMAESLTTATIPATTLYAEAIGW
jgi:hypothetical protein